MAHILQVLQPSHCLFSHKCLANNKDFLKKNIIPENIFSETIWKTQCMATKQHHQRQQSLSYEPSSWSYEFMEFLANQDYHQVKDIEEEEKKMKRMEEKVRRMLENDESVEPLALLELIDDVLRFGIGYRFQDSIETALERLILLQSSKVEPKLHHNLYSCALYFRLLRQHGYRIFTDIFERFKGSNGKFPTSMATDIEGLLSLFEASHLAFDGESILDEAREFTSFHLNNMIGEVDTKHAIKIGHALEFPLHHRIQRLEARWNIEMFDKRDEANQTLLELAMLDFNMVQSVHQCDLQDVSRWWKDVGLANKLSFARDRLMESFFWATGMVHEPQFSKCRIGLTKVVKLITVIDDIYDVYGSPQELEQLTDAVDKWDVNAVNHLPDYMKICFFTLYNTVNEMAYDTLKEHDQFVISHLKKRWGDLCKAFLREAEWNKRKKIPGFDEYLDHGWVSSSGVVLLTHAYFLITQNITEEAIQSLNDGHGLLRFPSTIFRLANDQCSSKEDVERGEVAKAASCYMHQTGSSIEATQAYLRKLIDRNWKMMNEEITHINSSHFEKPFIQTAANLARIALCQYQFGDAHTNPNDASRNRVKSVIIEPIHKKETRAHY